MGRVEEPAGEVAIATEAPKEDLVDGGAPEEAEEPAPAIPVETTDEAPEQPETPVDVTAGAGLETTLEGHDTAVDEVPAAPTEGKEEAEDSAA